MCYAIPGRVLEINSNTITVEYFGERRRVRNDFYELSVGDYVYAQGGFVINKVTPTEAEDSLKVWKELFEELNRVDLRLTQNTSTLYQIANNLRRKYTGNSACVHGIIEFSNYCENNCLYCGLRRDNTDLKRYRMSVKEVIDAAFYAIDTLGFKALVLQSGEDYFYDDEKLIYIIKTIMNKSPTLLVLSIGEREVMSYKKFYEAGARGVLMRFETSNPVLYSELRPGHTLTTRLQLLRELKTLGYLIISGFLIGLPGQTQKEILKDIETTHSLGVEMFSFGPFIPHPQTPLKDSDIIDLETVLDTIARTRIIYPDSRILVTTATETLDKHSAAKRALLAGANSVMINVTPEKYHSLYYLYPGRAGTGQKIIERTEAAIQLLKSLGRAPSDLGV